LITRTLVPKGRLRWAAVSACMSKRWPLAVLRPWNLSPYQEAMPTWVCTTLPPGAWAWRSPPLLEQAASRPVRISAAASRPRIFPVFTMPRSSSSGGLKYQMQGLTAC
jgi:hypothetical protein